MNVEKVERHNHIRTFIVKYDLNSIFKFTDFYCFSIITNTSMICII